MQADQMAFSCRRSRV